MLHSLFNNGTIVQLALRGEEDVVLLPSDMFQSCVANQAGHVTGQRRQHVLRTHSTHCCHGFCHILQWKNSWLERAAHLVNTFDTPWSWLLSHSAMEEQQVKEGGTSCEHT